MKKFIIVLFISFLGADSYAQGPGSDWLFSAGVNTVANFGTRNPFEDFNESSHLFAFKHPVALAIERKWTQHLYIEQDFTLNGFKENEWIDNGIPTKDLTYFSTNTTLKYYFDDLLFKNADWLNLYVGGGIGIFNLDELNTSANVAFGTLVWVSDNIGIRLGAIGKFAFEADSRQYDNNHYQFVLQGTFRL